MNKPAYKFNDLSPELNNISGEVVEKIHPVHQAQIYAYLKATKVELGLLINFNVPLIKDGIGRYVLRNSETPRLKGKNND